MTSKFQINSVKFVTSWVYNLPSNNECTVCRCSLNEPSIYSQEKGIDSVISIGACNHCFHQECLEPWLAQNKTCPFPSCSQPWKFKK